jgi:REP-associated tyrosine transposase
MTRQLRQDYAGAIHHVITRGVDRSAIAVDEEDRERALALLGLTAARFELGCHAWCLLPNHLHLLVTSRLGNLSRAMHWLGTCTAQTFNQRHGRSGHLYQARFTSRVVDNDAYLLELARYLPLNPVRAQLCKAPADWPWSSYRATIGQSNHPSFLDDSLLVGLLGSTEAYVSWVADGMLATALDEHGVPNSPPRPTLSELLADPSERALANAFFRHGHTVSSIARHLGVSRAQIRRRLGAAT